MIDRTALLATLKPLVVELEDSIRERVLETPEVAEHLEHEHHRAVAAERTAMSLEEWRDGEITQAAVAWVLGCVFVRFLEDNGLIDQALISGPGGRRAAALGHREEHFRAHPSHSDREYLEECFREVAQYPAVAPLYDERHNPLWRLGPTADGARTLRETFTAIDPASGALVHDFTDPDLDTRFLGDLYQDLSEAAKKRYALLQTPEFVERFILDRTLDASDRRVRARGGAADRPDLRVGALPDRRVRAAVRAVAGARAGHDRDGAGAAVPRSDRRRRPQPVRDRDRAVSADHRCAASLRDHAPGRGPRAATASGDRRQPAARPAARATARRCCSTPTASTRTSPTSTSPRTPRELKEILGRGYHAVVGNPPYIAVQDAALRDAYRARYASCHGKYVADGAVHGAVLRARPGAWRGRTRREQGSSGRSPATTS